MSRARQARQVDGVRKAIEGKTFTELSDRQLPDVLGNYSLRGCVFEACHFGYTSVSKRRLIKNVKLVDCKAIPSSGFGSPVLEDVDAHNLATSGLCIAYGAVYKHVRISGKCGSFMLNIAVGTPREEKAWRKANDKFYETVDWALDISEGEFAGLDIRGVPADLIRRDPETQVVVRRERVEAMRHVWEKRDVAGWPVSFGLMKMFDLPDKVLVAAKRSKNFARDLAALKLLRRLGVAEPD
ncbi:MAG: hypothetical protein WKG00_31820 [Polyangiaceae bacterium]